MVFTAVQMGQPLPFEQCGYSCVLHVPQRTGNLHLLQNGRRGGS